MTSFELKIVTTNNPKIIKFEANQVLLPNNNLEFNNIDEAQVSPLAQQLFYLPFVKSVYLSHNFIAVAKYDIVEWPDVQEELLTQLQDYLNNGGIIVKETSQKKVPVTVYAESTPNPTVMKFVANKKLVDQTFEFKSIDDTKNAPFAKALFHFPFVKEVFLDENYVSITKYDVADWNEIALEIRSFIREYVADNKPFVEASANPVKTENITESKPLDDTSKEIVAILDQHIKPAVASDGGNIMFQSYDENTKVVSVVLQGACSGCPSSTFTLKNGIEQLLKDMLPEKVNEVVAING